MDTESISYKHDEKYLRDKLNWPLALIKATQDPYEYVLKLKDGDQISFTEAQYISDDFVKLVSAKFGSQKFNRGLEIRVSEIVWVADAPNGVNHVV
jgi:hypothetical protein